MTMRLAWSAGGACVAVAAVVGAQMLLTPKPQVSVTNLPELAQRGRQLLEKARAGSGSEGITLERAANHYTMLSARTKSGGAEQHARWTDMLFVIDGEGTELTGGTIVDAKTLPEGEVRGTRLEGATEHALHTGDMIEIPAGTPHQAIEAPGQTITIYVVKVSEPSGLVTPVTAK